MAKKQTIDENIAFIKKAIEDGKAVIGTDKTMSGVRNGTIGKVFVSSNCPEDVVESFNEYQDISGIELTQIDYPNEEFAVLCKKPFSISVIGILKQ